MDIGKRVKSRVVRDRVTVSKAGKPTEASGYIIVNHKRKGGR